MTSLLVINIQRELNKGQKSFSDKTVRVLLATIEAYEKRVAELEAEQKKAVKVQS